RPRGYLSTPRQVPGANWSGTRSGANVSNLVWSRFAGQHIVVVMKPLVLDDGRPVHVSVVTPAASFERLLTRQDLPPRWMAAVLDGQRRVVAHSRASGRFLGREASPELRTALAAQPRGVARDLHIEATPAIAAFDQLPGYGWTAVVAMPRDD